MKKFGTPIGAGPGRASVKVGFAVVGVPSVWRIVLASGVASASACSLACFSASRTFLCSFLPTVSCCFWPPAETEGAAGSAGVVAAGGGGGGGGAGGGGGGG